MMHAITEAQSSSSEASMTKRLALVVIQSDVQPSLQAHRGSTLSGLAFAKPVWIDFARNGGISRGVLLDIPKLRKVDWLENDVAITASDLDAAEKD
jgi:hypothetical protein